MRFLHDLYFHDEVGVWQRTGARWVGRQWSWRHQWWLRNQDSDHLSWFILLFINGVMESSCCNRCNKRIFNALWEWHDSFLTFLTKLQKEIQSNFEGIVQWALCVVVSQVKEDRTVTCDDGWTVDPGRLVSWSGDEWEQTTAVEQWTGDNDPVQTLEHTSSASYCSSISDSYAAQLSTSVKYQNNDLTEN